MGSDWRDFVGVCSLLVRPGVLLWKKWRHCILETTKQTYFWTYKFLHNDKLAQGNWTTLNLPSPKVLPNSYWKNSGWPKTNHNSQIFSVTLWPVPNRKNPYLDNLQFGLIESHKSQVKTREETGHTEQNQNEDDHQPDRKQKLVNFNLEDFEIGQQFMTCSSFLLHSLPLHWITDYKNQPHQSINIIIQLLLLLLLLLSAQSDPIKRWPVKLENVIPHSSQRNSIITTRSIRSSELNF